MQVVETYLIGDLWTLFSPVDVGKMQADVITSIAAQSSESQALRQRLEKKLGILEGGMQVCEKYSTHIAIHN